MEGRILLEGTWFLVWCPAHSKIRPVNFRASPTSGHTAAFGGAESPLRAPQPETPISFVSASEKREPWVGIDRDKALIPLANVGLGDSTEYFYSIL